MKIIVIGYEGKLEEEQLDKFAKGLCLAIESLDGIPIEITIDYEGKVKENKTSTLEKQMFKILFI